MIDQLSLSVNRVLVDVPTSRISDKYFIVSVVKSRI